MTLAMLILSEPSLVFFWFSLRQRVAGPLIYLQGGMRWPVFTSHLGTKMVQAKNMRYL